MKRTCLALAVLAGCPSDGPPECVEAVVDCQPLYVPTFDNVYANTLALGCGSTSSSCHSRAGRAGGMSFETPETAHAALLAGRVVPGDPGCSEMIVRTQSAGESFQMPPPPGDALGSAEVCALVKWIEMGAPGPGVPAEVLP